MNLARARAGIDGKVIWNRWFSMYMCRMAVEVQVYRFKSFCGSWIGLY